MADPLIPGWNDLPGEPMFRVRLIVDERGRKRIIVLAGAGQTWTAERVTAAGELLLRAGATLAAPEPEPDPEAVKLPGF